MADYQTSGIRNIAFLGHGGEGKTTLTEAMLYAAGFGFVYRSFRVFHIAMGAQFVFSCYAFYQCAVQWKLPLVFAVCGALVLSVVFAFAIEWAVYRPFFRKGCSSGVVMIAPACASTGRWSMMSTIPKPS